VKKRSSLQRRWRCSCKFWSRRIGSRFFLRFVITTLTPRSRFLKSIYVKAFTLQIWTGINEISYFKVCKSSLRTGLWNFGRCKACRNWLQLLWCVFHVCTYLRRVCQMIESIGDGKIKANENRVTRGRCYDHNFLRFSTILGKKLAFFSKTNAMIKFLHNLALFWVQNANFSPIFCENIKKIVTSVPD
jgi:hypothetical protein